MNIMSVLIVILIVVAAAFALRVSLRHRGKNSCYGGCSGCRHICHYPTQEE